MTLVEKYAADKGKFVCIMSVYNASNPKYPQINKKFKEWLRQKGFQFELMDGYYKGEKEPESYFIISDKDETKTFKTIAKTPEIDQEAIIIKPIGTDVATMVYLTRSGDESIGRFQKIEPGTEGNIEFMSRVKGQNWYWRYA